MMAYELAKALSYSAAGADNYVRGPAFYDDADEDDIAIVYNKDELLNTKAKTVITQPTVTFEQKTLIMTFDNLNLALVKAADFFVSQGVFKNYSISDSALLCVDGYYIGKNVKVGRSVKIYPGTIIGDDVIIGDGCVLEPNAVICSGARLGKHVYVGLGSKIGAETFFRYIDKFGITRQFTGIGSILIGDETRIGNNTVIERGTLRDAKIGKNCIIGSNVVIGHDVRIGNGCVIVSQAGIAGKVKIMDGATVYGQSGISNGVTIGKDAVVTARTSVIGDVKEGEKVFGLFGREFNEELKIAALLRRDYKNKGGI